MKIHFATKWQRFEIRKVNLSSRMKIFLMLVAALIMQESAPAATNDLLPLRTNFVSGASLSGSELESVIKLAKLCGIENVTAVSTARHLSGVSIAVRGDEKIDARKVLFKTLLVRRVGWPGGKPPTKATRSIDEFWVEASTRPQEDERTIARVGDRTFWVGLLNGIKPEAADRVIAAFVNGRVRYESDFLKEQTSSIDFAQPTWLGISGGRNWISFASPAPSRHIIFQLKENEVTVLDVITFYE